MNRSWLTTRSIRSSARATTRGRRRAALTGLDIDRAHAGALGRGTGTEAATGPPESPGERRETRDRPPCLPAVGALVHRGAADQDHALFGRGVAAGEGPDRRRRDPGLGLRPLRGVLLHVCRQ